jgi:hypothetical protein
MPKKVPKQFLGAFKAGHRKGVREYIDEEFSYQLLAKAENGDKKALAALEWITKYNNETYRGVLKKNDPTAIHNTDKLYKEASDAHNANNSRTSRIARPPGRVEREHRRDGVGVTLVAVGTMQACGKAPDVESGLRGRR